MKISGLYVHPVKSLRPISLESAEITKHGFRHDRRFMLLRDHRASGDRAVRSRFENMLIGVYSEMALFVPAFNETQTSMIITFANSSGVEDKIVVDLEPDFTALEPVAISLHGSECQGYDMGSTCNDWFSRHFGFPVVFVYLGPNLRPVLFPALQSPQTAPGWLSTLTKPIFRGKDDSDSNHGITFADAAPYLIASETSLDNVSGRLANDTKMDITKFRPNIVVSGAETAWEEDFWGAIDIFTPESNMTITLLHNCYRCQSITVDYASGRFGDGPDGNVLKLLQKDRRVDMGKKYSAVFGRYGFLLDGQMGGIVKLGDDVVVSKRNAERTVFDWPNIP